MSSILDALKKVEQERAVVLRETGPILDNIAAPGASPARPGRGILQLSPVSTIVGGVALMAVIAVVSVGVSLAMTRTSAVPAPPTQTALPASQAEGVPPEDGHASAAAVDGLPMKTTVSTPVVAPGPVVSTAGTDDVPSKKETDNSTIPEHARKESPTHTPKREEMPAADSIPVDIDQLPLLTSRMRTSLNLPKFKINFIGSPTSRNPRPSALINLERVYINDYVPGTRARIIAIRLNGIGIDIEGKQFFIER